MWRTLISCLTIAALFVSLTAMWDDLRGGRDDAVACDAPGTYAFVDWVAPDFDDLDDALDHTPWALRTCLVVRHEALPPTCDIAADGLASGLLRPPRA